jgi:hypothetical protein
VTEFPEVLTEFAQQMKSMVVRLSHLQLLARAI